VIKICATQKEREREREREREQLSSAASMREDIVSSDLRELSVKDDRCLV
jgi:hypothetical protein